MSTGGLIRIQARGAANVGRTHEESIVSMVIIIIAMTSGARLKTACSQDAIINNCGDKDPRR